jgi:hypothetical protein
LTNKSVVTSLAIMKSLWRRLANATSKQTRLLW